MFFTTYSLEIFLPLDFQSWQSCYTANFYWIIKGIGFDAVGYTGGHSRGPPSVGCIEKKYNRMFDSFADRENI
jgi:hypothetical protein